MEDFAGFDAEAIGALQALPDWTREDRAVAQDAYDHLVETTKQFAQAIGDRIRETISDTVAVEPKINGSISPFNRDLRFAEDRSLPYKDHLMVNFWDGPDKKTAPTLRIRLTPTDCGFGGGAMFSKEGLEHWRSAMAGDAGADMTGELDALAERHPALDVPEPELKRVPGEFGADHPHGELLRRKSLFFRWQEPNPSSIGSAAFVDWCGERLDDFGPVHHLLKDSL